MNKNSILTDSQLDFRTKSLMELAVASISGNLLQNLDDEKVTCAIFLDLKRAFDFVDFCVIFKKLYYCGFHGSVYFFFFEGYSMNCKICTYHDGIESVFRKYHLLYH